MAKAPSSILALTLLALSVSMADETQPPLSDKQESDIRRATEWILANNPKPISEKWHYHFGQPPINSPYLSSLMELPTGRIEDGKLIVTPAKHEGWWLLTDLETSCFWILISEGYFGAMHYYGPSKLDANGDLIQLDEESSKRLCSPSRPAT